MPSGRLPLEVFWTHPTGRRPRGRPRTRTRWRDHISRLAWEQLGAPGGANGSGRGEGCLGIPPEAAAPATRIQISGRKQNKTKMFMITLMGYREKKASRALAGSKGLLGLMAVREKRGMLDQRAPEVPFLLFFFILTLLYNARLEISSDEVVRLLTATH
ncbi:hypothetical protein D4764_19G0003380 [Takifugu flavidus]|uniref:Uncharacterized protein n=1 Tax=Takifugu flavidus TaxID=433684 RepID=A0A5C6NQW6_9TELE|nr:hypothetical protein D4764_19G0003380 [Takifugu flavidus]